MKKIVTIAGNTFKEAIRDRILYSLILFAILMIASSLVFSTISAQQYNKIVRDLGLTSISLFGILISLFLGMGLVNKEIEKKTVYNIFSKPVKRFEFIIGKYVGLAFTLFVITVSMSVILFLIVFYVEFRNAEFISHYYGGLYYKELFIAVFFQYLEFLIVVGIALVFSSFTTPVLAALMSFLFFAVGRFSSDIKLLSENTESPIVKTFTEIIYRVIPNLEKFDFRSEAVYGGDVSASLVFYTTGYCSLYVLILLLLAITIFERREFK